MPYDNSKEILDRLAEHAERITALERKLAEREKIEKEAAEELQKELGSWSETNG